ncbi:T9SS type A sorting domain-containing protein [Flavobacteriales bacterium]|nr:T9SS type A sorting domain-containing protein [Flavobacteriales bacterium]
MKFILLFPSLLLFLNLAQGQIIPTDFFDYEEDQLTHNYVDSGSVSTGAYVCENNTMRVGQGNSDSWMQISMAVEMKTDTIIMRLQRGWQGSGGSQYKIDSNDLGVLNPLSGSCDSIDIVFTGVAAWQASQDGLVDFKIIDPVSGHAGDIQVSWVRSYSSACSKGGAVTGALVPDSVASGDSASYQITASNVWTYEWQQNSNGGAWMTVMSDTNFVGANTFTATYPSVSYGDSIQFVMMDSCGNELTSNIIEAIYEGEVGVKEVGGVTFDVSLYPNPSYGQFSIVLDGVVNDKPISVEVVTLLGQSIRSQQFNNTNSPMNLDLKNLVKGRYFIRVSDGGYSLIKPLVIM